MQHIEVGFEVADRRSEKIHMSCVLQKTGANGFVPMPDSCQFVAEFVGVIQSIRHAKLSAQATTNKNLIEPSLTHCTQVYAFTFTDTKELCKDEERGACCADIDDASLVNK